MELRDRALPPRARSGNLIGLGVRWEIGVEGVFVTEIQCVWGGFERKGGDEGAVGKESGAVWVLNR